MLAVQRSVAASALAVQRSAAASALATVEVSPCSQPSTHTQPHVKQLISHKILLFYLLKRWSIDWIFQQGK